MKFHFYFHVKCKHEESDLGCKENKKAMSELIGSTISISSWQRGNRHVNIECHRLSCGPDDSQMVNSPHQRNFDQNQEVLK